jgi:hypothetical protein
MRSRKSAPSVKIPASVLRREAQKAAKKMITAEKKKEKLRTTREKAKARTKDQIERKKFRKAQTVEMFDDHLQRELWASGWIIVGILLPLLWMLGMCFSVSMILKKNFENSITISLLFGILVTLLISYKTHLLILIIYHLH